MEFVAENLHDLPAIAKALLDNLGESNVIAFDGQMGAGKTTFIQTILRAMGIENTQGSPTYSLVNEYKSPFYGAVFHFDLYRLNSEEEEYEYSSDEDVGTVEK